MSKRRSPPYLIKVGARGSRLSRVQVAEVLAELRLTHPEIEFECYYVETRGDLDQKTSLRTLEKSDFFTREIDQMVLTGQVRIGIHSAKDLPDPLPAGLKCLMLTKGLDPSDSLVLREEGGEVNVIATSSVRREEAAAKLYPQARFVDIRGTIEQRLDKLMRNEVDGVVIAEAALIRLGLTHLKRVRLQNETAPLQGRLAVIGREEDEELTSLLGRGEDDANGEAIEAADEEGHYGHPPAAGNRVGLVHTKLGHEDCSQSEAARMEQKKVVAVVSPHPRSVCPCSNVHRKWQTQ